MALSKRGGKEKFLFRAIILLSLAMLSIVIIPFVHSFGVSTPYLENETLQLEPGQKYSYVINVQNGDEQGYDIQLTYSSTKNVALLKTTNRLIPAKSYDNPFIFEISIPKNALPGEKMALSYQIRPIVNNSGQVGMTVEIQRTLNMVIIPLNTTDSVQGASTSILSCIFSSNPECDRSSLPIYVLNIVEIILILAVFLYIYRLWKISKGMGEKLLKFGILENENNSSHNHHDGKHHVQAPIVLKPKATVTSAKTLGELVEVIEVMPEEIFSLPEMKHMMSRKLLSLHESFLAKKIIEGKKKKDFLKMLKS